jgi:hypothetical protein
MKRRKVPLYQSATRLSVSVMAKCQASEGCERRAAYWILIEYSWPTLPNEMRTYLLCNDHLLRAQRSASDQMDKYPETGIRIVEHGALAIS